MALTQEIKRHVGLGQRVQAYVYRGFHRGSGWSASLGDLVVNGSSQVEVLDRLADQIVDVANKAYDRGYLVQHEDGSITLCQWFGFGPSQVRVKDGHVSCSTSSDRWKTPEDAANDAVRSVGPGVVVRL